MVFGSPERGGLVAKGFRLEPPDLRGASFEQLNAFQDRVRSLLTLATPGRRLQIQWWADSDYRQALRAYHARTQDVSDPMIRAVRNERFTRYWPRTLNGSLRREHLAIFLSIEIEAYAGNVRSHGGLHDHYAAVLRELAGQFEEFASTLRTVFGPETRVHPMNDAEHCACLRRFLNPSHARRTAESPADLFDPTLTMQENCWHSEGVGQRGGGFFLDGHYHAVLALSRWPQRTRPGIVTHLTGLPFLDYAITVNVTPIGGRQEINREEKATERLRGEYAEKPRASLLVALRKKERKVEALAGGFARPFRVTYLLRVWAQTPEALREKIAAVQAAVNAMDGAQSFECALPTTAKKLFFSSWPGWTHSSYHHRELYAEDGYIADLLPFSATFGGALDHAEALYDGNHGNLVGVSAAVGGSPQHAVLSGMTGAGKSAFIEDLLFQTADHFSHSLLIEEGFSYKRFTVAMGETPIVIHPDAALTLNYLDTQRLPLTQLHLATTVALLARSVGQSDHAQELALRQAQLTQYLHQLLPGCVYGLVAAPCGGGGGRVPVGVRLSWLAHQAWWRDAAGGVRGLARPPGEPGRRGAYLCRRADRASHHALYAGPGDRATRRADGVRVLRSRRISDAQRTRGAVGLRAPPGAQPGRDRPARDAVAGMDGRRPIRAAVRWNHQRLALA